jgi:hypothetical protein
VLAASGLGHAQGSPPPTAPSGAAAVDDEADLGVRDTAGTAAPAQVSGMFRQVPTPAAAATAPATTAAATATHPVGRAVQQGRGGASLDALVLPLAISARTAEKLGTLFDSLSPCSFHILPCSAPPEL